MKFSPVKVLSKVLVISTLIFTQSCGIYSFSGVNIPPDVKTISIQNMYNNAGTGPANLGQKMTEALRDYFQRNTSLVLVNTEGDLQVTGDITGYTLTPVAPTASTGNSPYPTSSSQLTIRVKINYVNTKDEKANYEQEFSQYQIIPQGQSLTAAESQQVETIINNLVQDIFNKTFSNW